MRLDELTSQLAIDFTNTVSWRTSPHPEEWLQTPAGVFNWLEEQGLLTKSQRSVLEPKAGSDLLEQAVLLREAGRELLLGRGDRARNIDVLNGHLRAVTPQMIATGEVLAMGWDGPSSLDNLLWPIAYSFAGLLTSEMRHRVRECLGEGCGWLFLDVSKNRSRKWCDMSDCGNRAKAKRHYAKISTARQKRR